MKRIALIITILLLFPSTIKGYGCNQIEWNVLDEYSKNIVYYVEDYVNKNGVTKFSITFSGVSPEFKIRNEDSFQDYLVPSIGVFYDVTIDSLDEGKTYVFGVRGATSCFFEKFKEITITLPIKNKYYGDVLCEDSFIPLCQKWNSNNNKLSYDEFKEKIVDYKNGTSKDDQVQKDDDYAYLKFYAVYEKYYFTLVLITLTLFVGLLLIWVKRRNESKL